MAYEVEIIDFDDVYREMLADLDRFNGIRTSDVTSVIESTADFLSIKLTAERASYGIFIRTMVLSAKMGVADPLVAITMAFATGMRVGEAFKEREMKVKNSAAEH